MARHRSRLPTASPARARRASARASRACGSRGARKRRSRSASARSSDVPPRSCHDSAALPDASVGTTFGHDTGHQPARPDCGPTSRQSAAEWSASADSKASVRARSSVSVVPSRPSVIRRVAPPRRATATAVAGHTPHDGRSRASRRIPAPRSKAAIGADGSISSAARLPSSSDSLSGASSRPPGWRSTRTRSGVRAWRWSAAAPVGIGDDEHAAAHRAKIRRGGIEAGAAAGDDDGRSGGEARQAERHVGADEAGERGIETGAGEAAEVAIVDLPQRAAGVARFRRQLARRHVAVVADRAIEIEGEAGGGRGHVHAAAARARHASHSRRTDDARGGSVSSDERGAVGRQQPGAREIQADHAAAEVGAGVGALGGRFEDGEVGGGGEALVGGAPEGRSARQRPGRGRCRPGVSPTSRG